MGLSSQGDRPGRRLYYYYLSNIATAGLTPVSGRGPGVLSMMVRLAAKYLRLVANHRPSSVFV